MSTPAPKDGQKENGGAGGSPKPAPSRARLDYVDVGRGFAVLFMIQWHCVHAWLQDAWRQSPAYEVAQTVGGFAAPGFLFLAGAGVSLRFAAEERKGIAPTKTALAVAQRGAIVLVLGYLLRAQFAIASGAARNLLRFDVLQVIGLSMAIGAGLALLLRALPRSPTRLLVAGLLVFAATPLMARAFPADTPAWLTAPLVRPAGQAITGNLALFPLFPYLGHLLVGTVAGIAWDRGSRSKVPARVVWVGALVGLVVCAICFDRSPAYAWLARRMPGPDGGAMLRYLSRDAVVMIVVGLSWLLVRFTGPVGRVIGDLGKASMPVYWIHLSIAYLVPQRKLDPTMTVVWMTALTGAMWVVALVRLGPYERLLRRLRERRSGGAPTPNRERAE